ncbi:MAG: hypothetical protein ACRDRZ_07880 [Pseudonocardiaceae bacterium]
MNAEHRRRGGGGLAGRVSEALAMDVFDRLHQLDEVAAETRRRSAAELERIRDEMRRMISMWWALLQRHSATDDGRCPECRTWWGWRRRWPCEVWMAAHANLVVHHPAAAEPEQPVETAMTVRPPVREAVTVAAPAGFFHPAARWLASTGRDRTLPIEVGGP